MAASYHSYNVIISIELTPGQEPITHEDVNNRFPYVAQLVSELVPEGANDWSVEVECVEALTCYNCGVWLESQDDIGWVDSDGDAYCMGCSEDNEHDDSYCECEDCNPPLCDSCGCELSGVTSFTLTDFGERYCWRCVPNEGDKTNPPVFFQQPTYQQLSSIGHNVTCHIITEFEGDRLSCETFISLCDCDPCNQVRGFAPPNQNTSQLLGL
jgi:hypothetical protein